jgi:hypothetical protein
MACWRCHHNTVYIIGVQMLRLGGDISYIPLGLLQFCRFYFTALWDACLVLFTRRIRLGHSDGVSDAGIGRFVYDT